MKLGAVIIPASTLLQAADLADRIPRGQVRHVITETAQLGKFGEVPGEWTRIVVGGSADGGARGGLAQLCRRVRRTGRVHPGRGHAGQRPAAALLHLGYHGPAQARRPYAGQLPGGAPVHHVLDRHPAGRRAPEPVLAGLGQARLEQRVRAVERGRDRPGPELRAVLGFVAAGRAGRLPGEHVLRPAHGVADAHPGRPGRGRHLRAARVRGRGRAAEPRGDRAGAQGLGDHGPGRVRPDRDHRAGRQHARTAGPRGLDGPAAARVPGDAGRSADRRAGPRRGDLPGPLAAGRSG